MEFDVVIVGGGHGGAQAAIALRQAKFTGTIAIIGDEFELPYERPPLSKDYLAGEKDFERLLIRQPAFWTERDIAILSGQRVTAVDAPAHTVTTAAGTSVAYGQLIWAAGGSPRRLTCEGHHLSGIHAIRTRADVDLLRVELATAERVVVVGGGYIGLEAAAVLSKRGKQVTILEAQPRVLARVAGEPLSRFLEAEHRAHGVDIRLGVEVTGIIGSTRATGVMLAGGEIVPAEVVIVGIGIVPAVAPLLAAGAEGSNGVAVDIHCRTSLPDVFAIGDCALHPNAFANGAPIRLESVQNANDQASAVARQLTGGDGRYHTVPWFWSNQYDLRLQTMGLATGFDDVVVRGAPETRSFSLVYLRRNVVVALDCINATRDYVHGKALVVDRRVVAREVLADASRPLKDIGLPTATLHPQ